MKKIAIIFLTGGLIFIIGVFAIVSGRLQKNILKDESAPKLIGGACAYDEYPGTAEIIRIE